MCLYVHVQIIYICDCTQSVDMHNLINFFICNCIQSSNLFLENSIFNYNENSYHNYFMVQHNFLINCRKNKVFN